MGNRLTQIDSTKGTTTYVYDANDRLLTETLNQIGGSSVITIYDYDDNGNTISKTIDNQQTIYTWNDENRLVAVQTADGKAVGYTYNTDGIRVSSTVDGVTTQYLVDSNRDYAQVLEEYVDGVRSVSYVYGRDLIAQERSSVTSFYLVDGLGSTTALTDANGNVTDTYSYEAFGELEGQTGATENNYLFAGEQCNRELGGYYLRQRNYDTGTGRFIRRDAYEGRLTEPLTLHKYIYAHDNPIINTDPSGFITLGEVVLTSALIGILYTFQATPFLRSGTEISDTEAYAIEQKVVEQSKMRRVSKGGDAFTFAELMQYTASQIRPVDWVLNTGARIDFLRMAVDILTDDDIIYLNLTGRLGDNGPRAHRPDWLRNHEDDGTGWKIFVNDDIENGVDGPVTGRRDHFLSNAMSGFVAGGIADLLRQETSRNDMVVNEFGRRFGEELIRGTVSQNSVRGWIISNLAP